MVQRPRRFPASVESELTARQSWALAAVADRAPRVLDLDDSAARRLLSSVIAGDDASSGAWDAVVSVAQLVRYPDLAAALQAIDRLLAPAGRLVAVEPVARPGTVRMFLRAPFALAPSTRGFHLGRDLPAAVRTTTLVVDDIERFTLRSRVPTLRHFVAIGARRAGQSQETP